MFIDKHRKFWNREHGYMLLKMTVLLVAALTIQHFADQYVGQISGIPVGDLLLSHIPAVDIDFFVVQGALIFTFLMLAVLAFKPRYIIFTMAAFSLFLITRSFFISLTHLGVDPHEIVLDTNSWGFGLYNALFNTKSDFFFSGHTGTPFLMGLIFMSEKFWSRFFFAVSAIMGISVLLGHIHYSIDVFAAPFMTFGIFSIARKLFPKSYALISPSTVEM